MHTGGIQMGRPFYFNTRVGDILRADVSINQSTFATIMFSKSVNHYSTHLSDNDPDYYNVIDDLSFDNEFWGYDTLDSDVDTEPTF